jgi:hypothetical protein
VIAASSVSVWNFFRSFLKHDLLNVDAFRSCLLLIKAKAVPLHGMKAHWM